MKVGDYEVKEGLHYSKEHEWVKVENGMCRVGINDYAQKKLHEVVYADLPKVGLQVSQMDSLGTVESVKAVADLFSPISGEVMETNEKLKDSPELLNKKPYDEGWIAVLKPSRLQDDLNNLMEATSYADYLKKVLEEEQ
ncbi:glycine cleavage system protein GcvH [[Eubacterium] cellulosolvens]